MYIIIINIVKSIRKIKLKVPSIVITSLIEEWLTALFGHVLASFILQTGKNKFNFDVDFYFFSEYTNSVPLLTGQTLMIIIMTALPRGCFLLSSKILRIKENMSRIKNQISNINYHLLHSKYGNRPA